MNKSIPFLLPSLFLLSNLILFTADIYPMLNANSLNRILSISRANTLKKRIKLNKNICSRVSNYNFSKNKCPRCKLTNNFEFGESHKKNKPQFFRNENFYSENKIAIIGLGHIGMALAKGFIAGRNDSSLSLILSSNNKTIEKIFLDKANVQIAFNNREAVENADIVILAVKPLDVKDVLSELEDFLKDKILVSLAAGVSTNMLKKMTDNNCQKIIRVMSNLAVECHTGLIGLHANDFVNAFEKKNVIDIFSSLGKVLEIKNEEEIDLITIFSGSGPALVSFFIQSFIESAEKFGLTPKQSKKIMLQTLEGTSCLLAESNITPNNLIDKIATKGGATEQIINEFNLYEMQTQIEFSLRKGIDRLKYLDELVKSQL